jgi:hypothetical protein
MRFYDGKWVWVSSIEEYPNRYAENRLVNMFLQIADFTYSL